MRKILILPKNYMKEYKMFDLLSLANRYEIEDSILKIINDDVIVMNYKPAGDDSEIVEIMDVVDNWHVSIEDIVEECLCCGLTEKEKISENEYKVVVNNIEYRIYK